MLLHLGPRWAVAAEACLIVCVDRGIVVCPVCAVSLLSTAVQWQMPVCCSGLGLSSWNGIEWKGIEEPVTMARAVVVG